MGIHTALGCAHLYPLNCSFSSVCQHAPTLPRFTAEEPMACGDLRPWPGVLGAKHLTLFSWPSSHSLNHEAILPLCNWVYWRMRETPGDYTR